MVLYRHVRPTFSAYAAASAAAVAAQFGFVSLFNDSTGAYLLALHDYEQPPTGGTPILFFTVAQTSLGGSPVQGNNVVAGREAQPGRVTFGTTAAVPAASFYTSGDNSFSGWAHDFPIIVLQPGWSITAYAGVVNLAFSVSYYWQGILAQELDSLVSGES